MFKPENRSKLMIKVMGKIDLLQSKMIGQAENIIEDMQAFEKCEIHLEIR